MPFIVVYDYGGRGFNKPWPSASIPLGTSIVAIAENDSMKGKYFVAAGLAIIGAGVYFWLKKKNTVENRIPEKENERHHLTNVFSKAKKMAVGN